MEQNFTKTEFYTSGKMAKQTIYSAVDGSIIHINEFDESGLIKSTTD